MSDAASVQLQRDKDALSFLKNRLAKQRGVIANRVSKLTRAATDEEKALLAAYKEAARALGAYVAKKGIQPVSLEGVTTIPVVSANFLTDQVVGTREEQVASAEAFRAKNEDERKALDKIEEDLDVAFHTAGIEGGIATAIQTALERLAAMGGDVAR